MAIGADGLILEVHPCPEKAVSDGLTDAFRNAGQVCISPTRFYVQENSFNKFAARFTEKAKGLKLGDGLDAAAVGEQDAQALEPLHRPDGDPANRTGRFRPGTCSDDL